MAIRKTSYTAGDEVDSKCTKCKMVLAHTVVAMVGDQIARVRCNTCGGEHAYRPPPTASEATAKRRRAERKAATADIAVLPTASDFEDLSKRVDMSTPADYSPKMELDRHLVIQHPKFGVGVVTDLKEGRKANVAFADGGRVLIYNR